MPSGVRGDRQRRRKISLACEPCRERKSRCDGGKPICSTCQRRSLGLEQCIYKLENARTASTDAYIRVLHERIRRLERACVEANVDVPSLESQIDVEGEEASTAIAEGVEPPMPSPSLGPPPLSHARGGRSPYFPNARRASIAQSSVSGAPTSSMGYLEMAARKRSMSLSSPSNMYDPGTMASHPTMEEPDPASSVTAMGTIIGDDDASSSEDFYGSSSTASFLKEAFDSMKSGDGFPSLGMPSNGPHAPRNNPQEPRRNPSYFLQAQKFSLPPRDLGDHLMDRFRQKVYYMYPFFHLPSFENAYRSLWQSNSEPVDPGQPGLGLGCYPDADASSIVFHCALNAIFALSCHFSDLPPADRLAASHTFFLRAKSFVGLDLIEANNLGVVQALLIIALTLQSTPYPSRCWNATGVACRVAQGLGLHTEHRQDSRDELEKEVRRRTWYGCVTMDMLVSMTYGRPTMTTQISSLPLPSGLEESLKASARVHQQGTQQILPRFHFYVESIRLCGILEEILSKMYQPWLNRDGAGSSETSTNPNAFNSLDTIVGLHTKLTTFEASLPPVLSWTKTEFNGDLSPEDESLLEVQKTVLFARFIYLRIMLLRPILTQLCINERASMSDGIKTTSTPDLLLSGTLLHCARSCVDAGVELLDLVHKTYQNQATGAWWWDALYACTAGIVLIIARTCPSLWPSLDQEQMSTSWDKCEEILKFIASFSVSGQQSLTLLQTIYSRVHSGQASKHHSPPASPQSGLPNETANVLLHAMPFEANNDVSMPAATDFQGFEDLGMVGSFFNWDTSLFDATGGVFGGDAFGEQQ